MNLIDIFRPHNFRSTEFLALKQVMNKQIDILGKEVKRVNGLLARVDSLENCYDAILPTLEKIEKVNASLKEAKNSIYKDITKMSDRRTNAD